MIVHFEFLLVARGALDVIPDQAVSSPVCDLDLIQGHDVLGQIQLVAEHAVLSSGSLLLGGACLSPYRLMMVDVVILIGPVDYVLVLEGLVACTQAAQSFVDVGVDEHAQGIVSNDACRTWLVHVVSTQGMDSLHSQLVGEFLLRHSRLLFLADCVTFVVAEICPLILVLIRLTILVEEGVVISRLGFMVAVVLPMLGLVDSLLLLLLLQEGGLLLT